MYELDHLFVMVDAGGPEAERLIALGLTEGEPNTHEGQGTACRRFFFQNAYLELVWVEDAGVARQPAIERAGLWPRWSARKGEASPFGLGLRPSGPDCLELPFSCWEYRPPYLPAPLAIHVGTDVPLAEPFWFYLAFGRRRDETGTRRPQPIEHAAGLRRITSVRLAGPGMDRPSAVAQAVAGAWVVKLTEAAERLAEITFDEHERGLAADLRPALPLLLQW